MQSPEDEKSLREFDAWLCSRAHSQAAIDAKIAELSDKALRKILQSYDYIDRLAGILENHGFGLGSQYWASEADLAKDFWAKVSKVRTEKERRTNIEEYIKSVWPKGIFDFYEWHHLADYSLTNLRHVAKNCSSWPSSRYLLNWAMLHRDKGFRDNWQRLSNMAVLIGQHHHHSTIKKASSPLETKDITCAKLWLERCPRFEQNERNHWDWERATTVKYMRMHSLTFDENGLIVPRTGEFNECLVEQILFRHSHIARGTVRMSQDNHRAPIRTMRDPHVDVLPSRNVSPVTTRRCAVERQVSPAQRVMSPTRPRASAEAHSQSPACDSSPGMEEDGVERQNGGISEASSSPRDHIQSVSRQVLLGHRPLTPPSSAGGLVPRGWKQYGRMIDDIMGCITEDDNLQGIDAKESVLSHLQNARNLCALQDSGELLSVQR